MNYQRNKDALTFALFKVWRKNNHDEEADFFGKNLKLNKMDAKAFIAFRAGVELGELLECSGHNSILEFLTSHRLNAALDDIAQKLLKTKNAELLKDSKSVIEEIQEAFYAALLAEKFSRKEDEEAEGEE